MDRRPSLAVALPAGAPRIEAAASLGRADARGFLRPAPLLALIFGALLLLACNVNALLGHRAVVFKHIYPHAYVLGCIMLAACKCHGLPRRAWADAAAAAGRALPWFVLFCTLVGVSRLASNGTIYQAMVSNYWDTDPYGSTSRRLGLPVLANVLGFDRNGYIGFWYLVLFATFGLAWRFLEDRGLSRIERLSLLSSSIFAYSLIGPGYNEIFVFLLGFYALLSPLGRAEKIVVATLMIATHETATPFVALALMVAGTPEERAEWFGIFAALYLAFVASYLFTWRGDVVAAVLTAGKPSPDATDNAVALVLTYPLWTILGVLLAYKLYWAGVLAALAHRPSRPMALAVLSSLILAVIGTDTSRLVEFSSLAFLGAMALWLPQVPRRWRTRLAVMNLMVPSLYVATNAEPLWGTGLYSAYLHAAKAAGLDWGRLFLP